MTVQAITEWFVANLQWIIAGGSGVLAWAVFNWVRNTFPQDQISTSFLSKLLYAPKWARVTVFVLASLISIGASAALASINGSSPSVAIDAGFAVLISQLAHGLTMSGEINVPDVPVPPVA